MAPTGVRLEELCSTWARVVWNLHPEKNVTFEVTYETKASSTAFKVFNGQLNHLVIRELTADTEYTIVVRAANDIGLGTPSSTLIIVTKENGIFLFLVPIDKGIYVNLCSRR